MTTNTKRIVLFLILTFGLMYVSHGLIALLLEITSIEWDNFPLNLFGIIGGGAPAFAALFVVYKMYNEEEKKEYWESVYLFKVSWFWWVVALLSPLIIGIIANVVYHGGWWSRPNIKMADIMTFPLLLVVMIFAGGVEELGWRGILQNKLSKKVNLIMTGIVIGILWGIWHGPLFLIKVFAHYEYAFSTYILTTIIYSLILTLIVHKTKSVMLAIIMHASINAFGNIGFGIPMEVHGGLLILLLVLFTVFTTILYFVDNGSKDAAIQNK